MWWPDISARHWTRLAAIAALAGLTAGCFQPLYGDRAGLNGGASVASAMSGVEVAEIVTPRGSPVDRLSVEMRNNLIFAMTGGGSPAMPTHRLIITGLGGRPQSIIVDIQSGRPDVQSYSLGATYNLIDLATGLAVVTGSTSASVSFNTPGQQQRFAGERGLRNAESRALLVLTDQIRNRLASYFVAGT